MIKYIALIIGFLVITNPALAAQPMVLLDSSNNESVPAEIKRLFQDALECKAKLNIASPSIRRYLNQSEPDNWHLTIPIQVFGMDAKEAVFYIDSSGELGYSYSATYKAPMATAKKNAAIVGDEKKAAAGVLSVEGQANSVKITCTSN